MFWTAQNVIECKGIKYLRIMQKKVQEKKYFIYLYIKFADAQARIVARVRSDKMTVKGVYLHSKRFIDFHRQVIEKRLKIQKKCRNICVYGNNLVILRRKIVSTTYWRYYETVSVVSHVYMYGACMRPCGFVF